ncbi:MAG: YdcF family protein [Duncaniella sp.]|nr:YdcF family protein [Duncaniella sp.]
MNAEKKPYLERIVLSLSAFIVLLVAFTVATNIAVVRSTKTKIYADTDSIPHNKAALLLGTNPLNRQGRPNTYFTNRINAAARLYHAGKVDFIIASGDNHTEQYDEPTAIRDSLIAHGVPENRIILDYAGFRTLDSVVRAKEIFGCDSITIISQADHCARALYLAKSNGMEAVAFPAPIRAGKLVKTRLTLREWLARDKMMLDIWLGKRPHFLGERIEIPDITPQKSYSTAEGITIRIAKPDVIKTPVDSLIVEFRNTRKEDGLTGEYFKIERLSSDSKWEELPLHREYEDEELSIVFNAVGWIVSPDTTFHMTVRPWFYEKEWKPGTYRLAKTFRYPPYPSTHKSDTAYVEFQIK